MKSEKIQEKNGQDVRQEKNIEQHFYAYKNDAQPCRPSRQSGLRISRNIIKQKDRTGQAISYKRQAK